MFESIAESYASDTSVDVQIRELPFESIAESYASDTPIRHIPAVSRLRVLPNPMPQTPAVRQLVAFRV